MILFLTLPAHIKLTFMDYLLTMLRTLLRRKLGHDNTHSSLSVLTEWCTRGWVSSLPEM